MALNQRKSSVLSDRNNVMSENNGQNRSVPAILARKRKSEAQTRNQNATMEYVYVSNNSMEIFVDENSENSVVPKNISRGPLAPLATTQLGSQMSISTSNPNPLSSRLPFSVLQTGNNLVNVQVTQPSESSKPVSRVPKFSHNDPQSTKVQPPAAKKLKMRQSWSQFREFTLTKTRQPVRSVTPLPNLNWADRQEMWDLICKKESGMYKRKTSQEVLMNHPSLQPRMRSILLDWLVEVCEVYRQHCETFYLSVDYIDRYLSVTKDMPKNRLQLIGVTCLFIASKIEEIYPPKLSEFAYVTDGACSEEEILQMELVILKKLNWGLAPMTPNAWMKMFMQLSSNQSTNVVQEQVGCSELVTPTFSGLPFSKAMQLMDLIILDMGSLNFTYSVLVTSALCLLQNRQQALHISGYTWQEISECVDWMTPFYQVLSEEPSFQPKSFSSIGFDNQHNIQSHKLELSVLERAQDLIQLRAKTMLSPVPMVANNSIEVVTPPELDSDVRYHRIMHSKKGFTVASNSVFMSPQGPNERNSEALSNFK